MLQWVELLTENHRDTNRQQMTTYTHITNLHGGGKCKYY